jgi:uncharacterized protein (TIGR04222 family)
MIQAYQTLWTKLRRFTFDDGTAIDTFAKKLATSQNWTTNFTQRAINEYKKFILLCCVSPQGAAPPKIVDEVWHLHLTYTQSYWINLCRNTLGKDIHHYPSAGGIAEDDRHLKWYKDTLQLYSSVFGAPPPSDIWPPPGNSFSTPKDPPLKWSSKRIIAFAAAIVFPFLFSALTFGQIIPYYLSGPQFLGFFAIYIICILFALGVYLTFKQDQAMMVAIEYFPGNATAFQIAAYISGKHRAIQTSIVDLITRELLSPDGKRSFLINQHTYIPDPYEKNPLVSGLLKEKTGITVSYSYIEDAWYDPDQFAHPSLLAIDRYARLDRPIAAILTIALYIIPLLRILQSIEHKKPVGVLLVEVFVSGLLTLFMFSSFNRKNIQRKTIESMYKEQQEDDKEQTDIHTRRFATEGIDAIGTLAAAGFLTTIFNTYSAPGYQNGYDGAGKYNNSGSGSSCGSSCGGGGCGGGCGGG